MARVLTGIQSTGTPHLGNILGAIIPAIELSKKHNDSFLFIADLHSLTQIKDGTELKQNTYSTAATWLSFGLDPKKTIFYKQSDIPITTELAWILSSYFPYQRLTLAHSFKDKSNDLKNINAALFTYPMLMAADILLYDADYVPVGKDQIQHLEITRDVASKFNNLHGETLIMPQAIVDDNTKLIIGTDGQKMSKSKNNIINIFLPDNQLKKQIMSIKTDSLPIESPKNPNKCNVFALYSLIAKEKEVKQMKENYENGGFGYGEAKNELFELILETYSKQRETYNYLMENKNEIDEILKEGSIKAKKVADEVIKRVKSKLGI
ncbi:MAG: tryptophan--tRNA ligase [Flavobacteriaceae bacterium]|nr:tryptophan--tRNA ligase [Flavobacteriaceae bacterium]